MCVCVCVYMYVYIYIWEALTYSPPTRGENSPIYVNAYTYIYICIYMYIFIFIFIYLYRVNPNPIIHSFFHLQARARALRSDHLPSRAADG